MTDTLTFKAMVEQYRQEEGKMVFLLAGRPSPYWVPLERANLVADLQESGKNRTWITIEYNPATRKLLSLVKE